MQPGTVIARCFRPYRNNAPEPAAPPAGDPKDQDSAVAEEVCSGCGVATRERGRLALAGFGSAAALFPPSAVRDFEAERDLRLRVGVAATASFATPADFGARDRLRVGFASEPSSISAGIGASVGVTGGDASGVTCAVGLRPKPESL